MSHLETTKQKAAANTMLQMLNSNNSNKRHSPDAVPSRTPSPVVVATENPPKRVCVRPVRPVPTARPVPSSSAEPNDDVGPTPPSDRMLARLFDTMTTKEENTLQDVSVTVGVLPTTLAQSAIALGFKMPAVANFSSRDLRVHDPNGTKAKAKTLKNHYCRWLNLRQGNFPKSPTSLSVIEHETDARTRVLSKVHLSTNTDIIAVFPGTLMTIQQAAHISKSTTLKNVVERYAFDVVTDLETFSLASQMNMDPLDSIDEAMLLVPNRKCIRSHPCVNIRDFRGTKQLPNVRFVQIDVQGVPTMILVPTREIKINQELLIDYQVSFWEELRSSKIRAAADRKFAIKFAKEACVDYAAQITQPPPTTPSLPSPPPSPSQAPPSLLDHAPPASTDKSTINALIENFMTINQKLREEKQRLIKKVEECMAEQQRMVEVKRDDDVSICTLVKSTNSLTRVNQANVSTNLVLTNQLDFLRKTTAPPPPMSNFITNTKSLSEPLIKETTRWISVVLLKTSTDLPTIVRFQYDVTNYTKVTRMQNSALDRLTEDLNRFIRDTLPELSSHFAIIKLKSNILDVKTDAVKHHTLHAPSQEILSQNAQFKAYTRAQVFLSKMHAETKNTFGKQPRISSCDSAWFE